jgi:hypothetical protein
MLLRMCAVRAQGAHGPWDRLGPASARLLTPPPDCPQAGTLRVGDIVAAGATFGKVRSLSNAAGVAMGEAGPSIAVQLIGLNAVPQAGDEFQVRALCACARLVRVCVCAFFVCRRVCVCVCAVVCCGRRGGCAWPA